MPRIRTVSVIIPYFNSHETFEASLRSALSCRPMVDEIVIVDDGSSGASRGKLERIVAACGPDTIKLVTHSRNLGGGFARNSGVAAAQNSWIFCLDSDNVMNVDFVESALLEAEKFPEAHVFAPQKIIFFRAKEEVVSHVWDVGEKAISIRDIFESPITPPASGNYLYSRESWEVAGGYPTKAGSLDAWGFGLRQLASGYEIRVVPETHYFHRITPNSYWTRESGDENLRSTRATGIIFELADRIPPDVIRKLGSGRRHRTWFTKLGARAGRHSMSLPGERRVELLEQLPSSWVAVRNEELRVALEMEKVV